MRFTEKNKKKFNPRYFLNEAVGMSYPIDTRGDEAPESIYGTDTPYGSTSQPVTPGSLSAKQAGGTDTPYGSTDQPFTPGPVGTRPTPTRATTRPVANPKVVELQKYLMKLSPKIAKVVKKVDGIPGPDTRLAIAMASGVPVKYVSMQDIGKIPESFMAISPEQVEQNIKEFFRITANQETEKFQKAADALNRPKKKMFDVSEPQTGTETDKDKINWKPSGRLDTPLERGAFKPATEPMRESKDRETSYNKLKNEKNKRLFEALIKGQ